MASPKFPIFSVQNRILQTKASNSSSSGEIHVIVGPRFFEGSKRRTRRVECKTVFVPWCGGIITSEVFPAFSSCIPRLAQFGSECPLCKSECRKAGLRPSHFVENIVTNFKGLDAFSGPNMNHSLSSVVGRVLDQCRSQEYNSTEQSVSANMLGPVSSQPSTQIQSEGIQECGAGKIDMNRVEQTLLGGLPPFDNIKGSDKLG
ncbi:hypothetical protein Patl1_08884 [Pistacia atlantica]|uniref:Uncharacterized protein n=1 Tax=Pistacia atlantica TaxID=434234 RepID=A0ACC1ADG2_9ROSI|nr:hypothetical protein Patl1_08884 [Pistacia atlantica]